MPVQFVCPHCSQLLSVGTRKIGTLVACPRCRRDVTVPDLETAAVSVAMRQAQKAPPEAPIPEFLVFEEPAEAPPLIKTDRPRQAPASAPRHAASSSVSGRRNKLPATDNATEQVLLVPRRMLYVQAGVLASAIVAAFGLGYLVGYGVAPESSAPGLAQSGEATSVQGFVRYTTETGEVRGDAHSVVIALPDGRLPTPKLGVQGLRPRDPQPLPGGGVLMSLELLGGAATRVADDGSYTLDVPEPGRYFLLFISRNAQRTAGSEPDEFQLALLQKYFQPAEELIGSQKFRWRAENLQPGVTSRSHDFGASGVP